MNPRQFLIIGGIVLALVGILGMVGVIGPTPDQSLFKEMWWFDPAENWAHLILGIVSLLAAFAAPASVQKPLVMIIGVLGIFFGLYNLFSDQFLGANLEKHADTLLHFVVGAWALWAANGKEG